MFYLGVNTIVPTPELWAESTKTMGRLSESGTLGPPFPPVAVSKGGTFHTTSASSLLTGGSDSTTFVSKQCYGDYSKVPTSIKGSWLRTISGSAHFALGNDHPGGITVTHSFSLVYYSFTDDVSSGLEHHSQG